MFLSPISSQSRLRLVGFPVFHRFPFPLAALAARLGCSRGTGSVVVPPAPWYVSSNGVFLRLGLSNLSEREWPLGGREEW